VTFAFGHIDWWTHTAVTINSHPLSHRENLDEIQRTFSRACELLEVAITADRGSDWRQINIRDAYLVLLEGKRLALIASTDTSFPLTLLSELENWLLLLSSEIWENWLDYEHILSGVYGLTGPV
jgi:hypothetical protein